MFSQSYLSALFAGLLRSLLGVNVVARAQVFIAAAVAQASMLGIALDMLLGTGQPAAFAVAFVRADATSQSTSLDRTLAPPEMTFFRFFVFPHFVCLSVFSCKQNLSRYLSVQP